MMKSLRIKTILVPIDFSKLIGPALDAATDLARRFGATIHLVHVHEFYYPPGLLAPVPLSITTFRDEAAARRQRQLRSIARRNDVDPANCHFLTGSPVFHEICHLARKITADLIVMPTHGHTGVTRLLGGSTAERIVQHSPCPVVVARGRAGTAAVRRGGFNTILVPVDFSVSSVEAAQYAVDLAGKVAARLILFHAVDMANAFSPGPYGMYDVRALEAALREDAEARMRKFVGRIRLHEVRCETVVEVGSAIPAICALAKERGADLIIIATHGRTGFKHLLMGSVAEQVVRRARCPVLVVPSHPEVRRESLTNLSRQHRSPCLQPRTGALTKRNRKLVVHSFPERRKTNRFRESHGGGKESRR